MIKGEEVTQRQVYEEWALTNQKDELKGLSGDAYDRAMDKIIIDHKAPIKGKLPSDIVWYRVTIEAGDEKRIYIMTENGWVKEFGTDTSIISVAGLVNGKNGGHSGQIQDLQKIINSGLHLDEVFVMIAAQEKGPFTIIDGNSRLTAHYLTKGLAGLNGYVGFSPFASKNFCCWTDLTPYA